MKKSEVDPMDWLKEMVRQQWYPSRKERRRLRRAAIPDICVGKAMWEDIASNPAHPLHDMQKRQIRREKLTAPWRNFKRWFMRITGITAYQRRKLCKRYNSFPFTINQGIL